MLLLLKKILTTWYTRMQVSFSPRVDKGVQILLSLKYMELQLKGIPLPKFEDVEFRAFSQNGEDGILLYIFSLIGTVNKRAVEICAGTGVECNTANLLINHGWHGLLFDGDEMNIKIGRNFYARCRDTFLAPPTFVNAWIDAENVNSLICQYSFQGEIDLLSLDMDGVDYWIWKAIECISPRVVILEYNEQLGFDRVTVLYDPKFTRSGKDSRYSGASLAAFCSLGKIKGYRLVGCNRQRLNAVFIRNDVGLDVFPEVPLESCVGRETKDYSLLKELSTKFPFVSV